jgi:hypothetical protein
MNRPATLIGAVVLNFLVGVVGIFIGLLLVWAFVNGLHERVGISPSAASQARIIIFGTPIHGALALIVAIGTWDRSRRVWWLGVAVHVGGLVFLAWVGAFVTPGNWTALVVVPVATLVLLVAPSTRAALRD